MLDFNEDISEILLTADEIAARVKELGRGLSEEFDGKFPLLIGVLKGSFIFMADLIRNIDVPCSADFMAVSSYGNSAHTTGAVQINKDVSEDVENRHIILIEDILDTGLTMNYLVNYFTNRNPASITLVTLLDKPVRRLVPIAADYVGFVIPNHFVVGYGLDYDEYYRNLPYIGVLKPETYSDAEGVSQFD